MALNLSLLQAAYDRTQATLAGTLDPELRERFEADQAHRLTLLSQG